MWEPRYHLRESQDLSAYEWEEIAGEFTPFNKNTLSLLLCAQVKYQSLFSLLGFDVRPWFESDPPPLTPRCENRAWSGPGPSTRLVGTAAQMIWALCRFHDSHFLSQHHELELHPQCSSDSQADLYIWMIIQLYVCASHTEAVKNKLFFQKWNT